MDYQWDKNELEIEDDVPCLCGSAKCRRYLMRARRKEDSEEQGSFSPDGSSSKTTSADTLIPQPNVKNKRLKMKFFVNMPGDNNI